MHRPNMGIGAFSSPDGLKLVSRRIQISLLSSDRRPGQERLAVDLEGDSVQLNAALDSTCQRRQGQFEASLHRRVPKMSWFITPLFGLTS
jgi:hypothetical protein